MVQSFYCKILPCETCPPINVLDRLLDVLQRKINHSQKLFLSATTSFVLQRVTNEQLFPSMLLSVRRKRKPEKKICIENRALANKSSERDKTWFRT